MSGVSLAMRSECSKANASSRERVRYRLDEVQQLQAFGHVRRRLSHSGRYFLNRVVRAFSFKKSAKALRFFEGINVGALDVLALRRR